MTKACRNCRYSTILKFDKSWKVVGWYCIKKNEVVPDYITIVCAEYENYESNLHVDDAARSSPQTRDKGIHQEE